MYYHNLAMSPQQKQPDTQQTESLGKGEREVGVGREGKKDSVINEQHKKIVSTAPWQLLRLFQALQTFRVLEILTYTCWLHEPILIIGLIRKIAYMYWDVK